MGVKDNILSSGIVRREKNIINRISNSPYPNLAGNPANLGAGYCIFGQVSGLAVYWISGCFISKQLHILVFFQKGEILASIGKTQLQIWPAIRPFGRLKKAGYSVLLQIEYQEYRQNIILEYQVKNIENNTM